MDAVSFRNPNSAAGGVEILDVVVGAGGPQPRAAWIDVTQATLSRDLKELALVKRASDGAYQRPGLDRNPHKAGSDAPLRRAVEEIGHEVGKRARAALGLLKVDVLHKSASGYHFLGECDAKAPSANLVQAIRVPASNPRFKLDINSSPGLNVVDHSHTVMLNRTIRLSQHQGLVRKPVASDLASKLAILCHRCGLADHF
jgi:hypothetical protein